MKKMILDLWLVIFNAIKDSDINSIKNIDDKYKILKFYRDIKKLNSEFENFRKDAQDKIIKDQSEFQKMFEIQDKDDSAKNYINNINSELQNLILKELYSEKELNVDTISKESFDEFITSNKFKLKDIDILESILQ